MTAGVGNRARRRSLDAGGTGAAPRRHDRVGAAGRGFYRRGRAAVRAPRRRNGSRRPRGAGAPSVAFGPERTLEQDPMFAFLIIVDIAFKALSPAINDPTTAVLALDQVGWVIANGRPAEAARRGDRRRQPGGRASSSAPRKLGNTTFKSPAAGVAPAARATSQGRAPHARDAREPPQYAAGTPPCRTGHRILDSRWIGRSKRISAVPRNSRWPGLPILRG